MLMHFQQKMNPRKGRTAIHVAMIGRVSTEQQQASNIGAGFEYARRILDGICDGQMILKEMSDVASGMRTDRPSLLQLDELIEDRWPDLVLMEDLSKVYRNPRHQYAFVQTCVDARVRVIAVGDNLDTWDENWEITLAAATMQHGTHIPHTRRRVRRTATSAFHAGGMVGKVRGTYRKLTKAEAASGDLGPRGLRIARVAQWTGIVLLVRQLIIDIAADTSGERDEQEAVDLMNQHEVPVGPHVKGTRWTKKLLWDLLRDPILYGLRRFRVHAYEYVYGSGEHLRIPNPAFEKEPIPELAHMTEPQWVELQAALDKLGSGRRNATGEDHPRFRVARADCVCPHQHVTCAICGAIYYDCGNNAMKCKNACHHGGKTCWNHVQLDAEVVRRTMVDMMLQRVEQHPQAKAKLLEVAWNEVCRKHRGRDTELKAVDREIQELTDQAEKLGAGIALGGKLETLVKQLKTAERALKDARDRRKKLEQQDGSDVFPGSAEDLEKDMRPTLMELARTSFEFSTLTRKIFTRFAIQPVQALDTPLVRPRGLVMLDLGRLGPEVVDEKAGAVEVDLFEPPLPIKHLAEVVKKYEELKAAKEKKKVSLTVVARALNIGHMTVKRAMDYRKLMDREGMTEPYRVLTTEPQAASRWRKLPPGTRRRLRRKERDSAA